MSVAMSDRVMVEEDMVFNTIACSNTHFNGSVGVGLRSCTSTAGEWHLSSITMLQQQASAHGNSQILLPTAERFVTKSITVLKQFRHSF